MSNNYLNFSNYDDRKYNYHHRMYNYDDRINVNITSSINKTIINRSNIFSYTKGIDHYNNINILLVKQRSEILLNIFNQNNKYLRNKEIDCYFGNKCIKGILCEYRH